MIARRWQVELPARRLVAQAGSNGGVRAGCCRPAGRLPRAEDRPAAVGLHAQNAGWRDLVDEGGVMSWGPDIATFMRGAARYVDRVLRGEKAVDLPVQDPTRLQLIINLKTARELGLTVPLALLARADEAIE